MNAKPAPRKIKVATVSLAGCFGCHMSFLDMDLDLVEVLPHIEILRSPFTDYKSFDQRVDVGLIEGGVCNDENLHVLREFRKNCEILVAVGECAIMGGLPALRNDVPLDECLTESYITGPTVSNPTNVIPHNRHLPKILDRVYPCHEIVKIDVFLPGCPPPGPLFRDLLKSQIYGHPFELRRGAITYE